MNRRVQRIVGSGVSFLIALSLVTDFRFGLLTIHSALTGKCLGAWIKE